MRKCCCCISVHVGAAILGLLGLTICAVELVVLVPYLLGISPDVFNPIEKNMEQAFYIFEDMLKENKFEEDQIQAIVANVKEYMWHTFIGATIEAGIYGLCALLMMIGASCQIRGLMIPYLVVQMIAIVILVLVGVGVTVAMCFYNAIMGVVAGVVTLIISLLLIYFWAAVQRAYVELGNNDYMYSPAPIKPVGHYDGRGAADHYPTSPQHFAMDERHH